MYISQDSTRLIDEAPREKGQIERGDLQDEVRAFGGATPWTGRHNNMNMHSLTSISTYVFWIWMNLYIG
jgi:hypothetical protein